MTFVVILFVFCHYIGEFILQSKKIDEIDEIDNFFSSMMRNMIDNQSKQNYNKCKVDWIKEGF